MDFNMGSRKICRFFSMFCCDLSLFRCLKLVGLCMECSWFELALREFWRFVDVDVDFRNCCMLARTISLLDHSEIILPLQYCPHRPMPQYKRDFCHLTILWLIKQERSRAFSAIPVILAHRPLRLLPFLVQSFTYVPNAMYAMCGGAFEAILIWKSRGKK